MPSLQKNDEPPLAAECVRPHCERANQEEGEGGGEGALMFWMRVFLSLCFPELFSSAFRQPHPLLPPLESGWRGSPADAACFKFVEGSRG